MTEARGGPGPVFRTLAVEVWGRYVVKFAGDEVVQPKTRQRMSIKTLIVVLVGTVSLACTDSTSVQLRGNVAVSFATRATPPALSSPATRGAAPRVRDDTLTSGSDTLIITSAQIVLREIELKPVESASCDSEPQDCNDIEFGPVLVDLPLAPGVTRQFQVLVPSGTFDEIEFDIHKVSDDDPADAVFRQQHPEFIDLSIRVQGTFRGQVFLYESDLNVEQELDLNPPLVVDQTTSTNVTIRVNLGEWFRTSGGALIDPATANKGGANENLVNENIKRAIEAFEDDDEDGNE